MENENKDGEIFDDDEQVMDLRRVKRRRDSESSDDSYGYYHQGPLGYRQEIEYNARVSNSRREAGRMGERDDNHWRRFRQQGTESDLSEGLGNPRAHSTAGGGRIGSQQAQHQREYQHARAPSAALAQSDQNNSSRSSGNKMFKVEPFPKSLKPTDQYQEWTFWIANFEMAAEKAGTTEQRSKAIDLSLHIGEEVRRIIVAKEMLPRESAVEQNFPFYDNLVGKLEEHFRLSRTSQSTWRALTG